MNGEYIHFIFIASIICVILFYIFLLTNKSSVPKRVERPKGGVHIKPNQKLVDNVSQKLESLVGKPENGSGLALYQVRLFEKDFAEIINTEEWRAVGPDGRLRMLIKEIDEFINDRKIVLARIGGDVLRMSHKLSSGIVKSVNHVRDLIDNASINSDDEIGSVIHSLHKRIERLRSESVIPACDLEKKDDIQGALTTLEETLKEMKGLVSEVETLFEARSIVKKYST